ncbi:MAG: hypothetical protein Q8R30_00025, partial [bacterium]|nr:hypothetical protein [bacterium]
AAKQNQKILSIFAAPPRPPAEGRKGKDFLGFARERSERTRRRVGVGMGSARTIWLRVTTRSARESAVRFV